MDFLHSIKELLHPETLIKTVGLFGIFGIIFAESGLLVGFFLPGDSLLFLAGFFAYLGYFNIAVLAVGCFLAAVIGDSVGYAFGRRVGRRLFNRKDSVFFHKDNLEKAEKFYEEHGKKTIVLARFLPIVRTFAPIVAGMAQMEYKTFLAYNVIGGFIWSIGLVFLGYFLGKLIPPDIMEKYIVLVVVLIIAISVLPTAFHILKDEKSRKNIIGMITKPFGKK